MWDSFSYVSAVTTVQFQLDSQAANSWELRACHGAQKHLMDAFFFYNFSNLDTLCLHGFKINAYNFICLFLNFDKINNFIHCIRYPRSVSRFL